ncbi:MAG TPA: transporter substrate-binding domain-containing protein [Candidatus Binatia bacterium]|nr:transporter substrate-binding domain-containing protein [Candidatus Binatia bacterium]
MQPHTFSARPFRLATVLLIAPVALLSACGSSSAPSASSGGTSSLPPAQQSIIAEIPSAVKSMEPWQIAADASYAPNEYVDPSSGDLIGWDLVLAKDVCAVLGQVCTINNVTFDDIIPALEESPPKYVMSFSSFTPTAAREKTGIDFITYYRAGESWMIRVGGTAITKASQMCGHSVAVEAGTVEESDAWGFMGKKPGGDAISGDTDNCTSAGLKDINVESFDTQTEANAALLDGRADFGWADQPVADYQVQQNPGKMKISGQPCSVYPYGVAVISSLGFDKAIEDAITYLINNGYYTKILQADGVTDGAVSASAVDVNDNNPVGSTCVPSY